jgi:hypothetical protein
MKNSHININSISLNFLIYYKGLNGNTLFYYLTNYLQTSFLLHKKEILEY